MRSMRTPDQLDHRAVGEDFASRRDRGWGNRSGMTVRVRHWLFRQIPSPTGILLGFRLQASVWRLHHFQRQQKS